MSAATGAGLRETAAERVALDGSGKPTAIPPET